MERVGARVRVFWEGEGEWFEGVVAAYSDAEQRFLVQYDDGEEQWEDADGETLIEFLSPSRTALSDHQQQQDAGVDESPPSPNYVDDDYDADEYEEDAEHTRASPKKSPTPEVDDDSDTALSPAPPNGRSPAPRGTASDSPPHTKSSIKQQQQPRKPALYVNNAVFFRDEETLRDMRKTLQQEKTALAHERQTLATQLADKEQLSTTLKRELQELKNRVTLASVLGHAASTSASPNSTPKTASDWSERVLDQKLQNKQRKQELTELSACVQHKQRALQQRQRECDQLKDRLARVPRRDLCTLVDLQVEIAALLEEKRSLLEAHKLKQQPPTARAHAATLTRDGTFGWTHGADDAKVALEKELGKLELSCSRAKDEIHRWKLSFERENARILPLKARLISLRQELAKFEAANVLLRSVFLRLEPDANGTIAAQIAAEALLTLAPPDHPSFASTDDVFSALKAQNALPSESEPRLAFADFVACFRCLFKQETSRATRAPRIET